MLPQASEPVTKQVHNASSDSVFENGLLFLSDDVDETTIPPLVEAIWELNLLPQELQPPLIRLFINSHGGSMTDGVAFLDAMRMSKIPIATIVSGTAGSMAQIIAMHGKKGLRCITSDSYIMSHQYSSGINSSKEHEINAAYNHWAATSGTFMQWYRKCTGKSDKYIRTHMQGPSDSFITPAEAVKHGLVDFILDFNKVSK